MHGLWFYIIKVCMLVWILVPNWPARVEHACFYPTCTFDLSHCVSFICRRPTLKSHLKFNMSLDRVVFECVAVAGVDCICCFFHIMNLCMWEPSLYIYTCTYARPNNKGMHAHIYEARRVKYMHGLRYQRCLTKPKYCAIVKAFQRTILFWFWCLWSWSGWIETH